MRLFSALSEEDKATIRETPWDIVVYHGECPDGVTAAWLVLRHLDWKPVYYGSAPNKVPYLLWKALDQGTLKDKRVIVVDLSFERADCEELNAACEEFLMVDHHQTAELCLGEDDFFIYGGPENKISGAGMIKKIYVAGDSVVRTDDPLWLVDYVSDRDTWQNVLPCSQAVNLALSVEGIFGSPKDMEHFYCTDVSKNPEACLKRMCAEGQVYLRYQHRLIQELLWKMKVVAFRYNDTLTFPIAILNSSLLQSDVANYVLRHQHQLRTLREMDFPAFGFAIVYTYRDPSVDDSCGFSVRCEHLYLDDNDANTVVLQSIGADDIAALFGGGGHAKAAGFYCSAQEFFERTSTEGRLLTEEETATEEVLSNAEDNSTEGLVTEEEILTEEVEAFVPRAVSLPVSTEVVRSLPTPIRYALPPFLALCFLVFSWWIWLFFN